MRLISVAVPVPFLDVLTYRLPSAFGSAVRGSRVIVPLGKRAVAGVVVDADARLDGSAVDLDKIKDVIEVLDVDSSLPEAIVDLASWVAEYYACGVGDVLSAAAPPLQPQRIVRFAMLTAQGNDTALTLRGRQKDAVEALRGAPDGLSTGQLKERGISADVLQRLAEKGIITFRRERRERDPFSNGSAVSRAPAREASRALTAEQAAALDWLREEAAQKRFSVSLLQGVTGSGKTEVYLRLARSVIDAGRSVLVLVPEIALTPAVAAAFREAFSRRVAVQHSGLSNGERADQWARIRGGSVSVVVGTRSAVFAPLANLGLIIVDEEHDPSFKQDETPRYNGRDVAVMRGKREGALVVLGSATPSLESRQNAAAGRYNRLVMHRRVLDRPLAKVSIVDMREEYAEHGPEVVISGRLKSAIGERLAAGQQSLILLNRRGLATAVFCRQCGGTLECPNCSVSLTIHTEGRDRHRARCHYCNYGAAVPAACPACKAPYLERRGFGTERVAHEIARHWPDARMARLDRDAVRRKGAAARILSEMAEGAIDVLVGTQMIAKGHDFPRVTLVGVVSADVGLGLADFRAAERTFQLLTQVAGRAGRGSEAGEAIIQTLYPTHYSILRACDQDYDAFFDAELQYRQSMHYPPFTALVNIVVKAPDARSAAADAATLGGHLRGRESAGRFRVLGPAPAPLARLRGEYRAQLFLKGGHRAAMREAVLAALAAEPEMRRRVSVDIDPVSIL